MLISDSTTFSYFAPKGQKPTILSPKTDGHWQSSKTIGFRWRYNGYDSQVEYEIEVYDIKIERFADIPDEWTAGGTESEIQTSWLAYGINDSTGTKLVTISNVSNETDVTVDMTPYIDDNGVYLWRIRTRGVVAHEWSDWAVDGYVRFDSESPVIKNVTAESLYGNSKLASRISDCSSPFIYSEREDGSKERHIDRDGNNGLYIYYDYRDHSVTFRAQSGKAEASRRYYAMLSFHDGPDNPEPTFSPMDAVKVAYIYKINKDTGERGPYEVAYFEDIVAGIKLSASIDELIYVNAVSDDDANLFIPAGFPKFWTESVYGTVDITRHPAALDPKNRTYYSALPFYSTFIRGSRTYNFTSAHGGSSTFTNFVEMRYAPPFHDIFILFNASLNKILAYGQYSTMTEANNALANVDSTMNFTISRGFNVEINRASPVVPDDIQHQIFVQENLSALNNYNRTNKLFKPAVNSSSNPYMILPKSDYMFVNLYADENYDTAIKIYLNSKIGQDNEKGIGATSYLNFIEVNMSPDADFSLAYRDEEKELGEEIPMDEVFIGRSKISPRNLVMYSETDPTLKKIYLNLKRIDYGVKTPVTSWGADAVDSVFNRDIAAYSASFRLKIPDYKFIPYYHPLAANYEEPTDVASLPYISDASANDINGDIRWDSFEIKTSKNDSDPNYLVKHDLIYPNDYIKFSGSATALGQINPFLYNLMDWEKDGVARGSLSRISSIGFVRLQDSYGWYGQNIFADGVGADAIRYNMVDRGFYALVEKYADGTKTRLHFKNFSNLLFRRALRLQIGDGTGAESAIATTESRTSIIRPERSFLTYTYIWESGDVLNSDINPAGDENGRLWIYNLDANEKKVEFINALISEDESSQGYFGDALDGRKEDWMLDQTNMFAGYYLAMENGETFISEPIKRAMIGQYPNNEQSVLFRSNFKSDSPIPETNGTTITAELTGDTFAMGNIFGHVTMDQYSPTGTIRLFFDIDDDFSGVHAVKYFRADLNVGIDLPDFLNSNMIETSQYIAEPDEDGIDKKAKVLLQKINNRSYDLNDTNSEDFLNAIQLVTTHRSPLPLAEWHLDNNILTWHQISTEDILNAENDEGVGNTRFYLDVPSGGSGYKIFYLKIKDKSGNESDIYPMSVYVASASRVRPEYVVDNAVTSADDDLIDLVETVNVDGSEYRFVKNLLPVDKDEARSIIVKNIVSNIDRDYDNYAAVDDLLIGFSDNLGMYYNVFRPFCSINAWKFNRPIDLCIKSFEPTGRGADWLFDPNDVRHYVQDSEYDYRYGVGTNNNETYQFHVPANAGLKNFTLIGFMDESEIGKYGRSNPVAKKMLEFKEEFIGKKLVLGSDLSQFFTILHIFKSNYLPEIKRFKPDGSIDYSISSAGSKTEAQPKIWIMIDDPDAIGAMILSRKFNFITRGNSDYGSTYEQIKDNLGYRSDPSQPFTVRDLIFGYAQTESEVPASTLETVNQALNVSYTGATPTATDRGDFYIYVDSTSPIEDQSGLDSNEGWITQYFHAYDINSSTSSDETILEKLSNHQYLGTQVINKLVFGKYLNVTANISESSVYSSEETKLILSSGRLDATMAGMSYSILDEDDNEIDLDSLNASEILKVSSDGSCVIVGGDLLSLLDFNEHSYRIHVLIEPLQSINPTTGEIYSRGWWPDIDGMVIPPPNLRMGTVNSTNSNLSDFVKFAAISTGAFFIQEDGYYAFKIESDQPAYADFCIDYMRTTGTVKDIFRVYGEALKYEERTVGGLFKKQVTQTYYLRKGWHIGRFRYVARYGTSFLSDTESDSYAILLWKKPNWGSQEFVPFMGAYTKGYGYMARAFKSVHCKIVDQNQNVYPKERFESGFDTSKASQYMRAIVGFNEALESTISNSYVNRVVLIENDTDNPRDNAETQFYGKPVKSISKTGSITYGGQVYEEAYGYYDSNIFDGGVDFRFWRTISWTGEFPMGTSVEFYLRSGATEQELLAKTWNNIGTESSPEILDPIRISGSDIIKFSQQIINRDQEDVTVNRFIQFRMVLKSTVRDVVPRIDDVTLTYSKQNSVNFFTTTFNLNSNMLRGLLSYNGSIPVDPSGISTSDIQFGICTEEDVDGNVSTNFDDYATVPVNEAFSLTQLGIDQNDKFRIGIRFISSENSIPVVDELGMLWETDGNTNKTIDFTQG